MRNFMSYPYGKFLGTVFVGALLLGLLLVAAAKAGAHEGHPFPDGTKVGTIHGISAICDARGVSKVAQADLDADNHTAGNRMFTELAGLDDPTCYGWGFPVPLAIEETVYVGTSATGLHVYIVKFGKDMYSAMTMRHKGLPEAKHGYDYERDSV